MHHYKRNGQFLKQLAFAHIGVLSLTITHNIYFKQLSFILGIKRAIDEEHEVPSLSCSFANVPPYSFCSLYHILPSQTGLRILLSLMSSNS